MVVSYVEGPEGPEGWTESEYKSFRTSGSDTESESDADADADPDADPDPVTIRGYSKEKYKKILFLEDLLPE